MLKGCLLVLLVLVILVVAMIYFGQHSFIYFPRGYARNSPDFDQVDRPTYRTDQGAQVSFLYPKGSLEKTPTTVWWLFGGNGSTALSWLSLLERKEIPEGHTFVLFDYPGYGLCQGNPSPEAIHESVASFHDELAKKWNLKPEELSARSRALGQSLGSAVALHTTAKYGFSECVAVSPFTSMKDMAKLKMGPAHLLLRHHYDNRKSVNQLRDAQPLPRLTIFHGDRDSLIPMRMGKELADLAGDDLATFHRVPGSDHNNIIYPIQDKLWEILSDVKN